MTAKKKPIKRNWAGNVQFNHAQVEYPATEMEIQELVLKAANARRKIRVIGTGHSFTKLCTTNHTLVSLDAYQGLVAVDHDKKQATVKGGTKLKLLGELLFNEGLAMENLGDVDAQSIAGTISTGTHGTGTAFGTISTQVIALKLINGKGEMVSCSATENPDLFKAAQVSLGLLGIITEVTLQCVPSYKLLIHNQKENLDDVLSNIDQRNQENRNFEYYWFPNTDLAWTKTTNIAESGEPNKDNLFNYLSELLLENYAFKAICEFELRFPSQTNRVSNLVAQAAPTSKKLSYSHKVYATKRLVRFKEMEYNVPAEAYPDVMKEVRQLINNRKFHVHFPIENRWVQRDDILMSPAYGRDSAYIACHVYHKKDHTAYFGALEEIFRAHGGRPHWGKMNTLNRKDVTQTYPQYALFEQVRRAQDPDGLFINEYLKELFG